MSLLLTLLGCALLSVPFHLKPDNFIVDDGYFYPQIARNIVLGHGSTFNGIMPTNGYHPLWMVVCVLAASITTHSAPLVQVLTFIQDLFLLGSLALLVHIGRAAKLHGVVSGCVPLVFFGMVLGIWRLLEANLALLLQISVLLLVVPVVPRVHARLGRWRTPLLGCLLGLTVLARLDLIFFAVTVLFYGLIGNDGPRNGLSRLRRTAILTGIVCVVLGPYLAWNWEHFHHLLPISGAIKSTFPHAHRWGIASFMYPVVLAIACNGSLLIKRTRTAFDSLCILTAAAAALHMAYTISFGEMAPWYMTTGYLSLSLCLMWISDRIVRGFPRLAPLYPAVSAVVYIAFLTLASLRLVSNFTYTRLTNGTVSFQGAYTESKRALAETLDNTLPPGSRIMIFDAPGGVAFYSKMSILPVDGLVADYAYNRDLVEETLPGYMANQNIDYFIGPVLQSGQTYDRLFVKETRNENGQTLEVQAPLTRASAGHLELSDKDIVFRFRQVNPDLESIYPQVGLWRVPHGTLP